MKSSKAALALLCFLVPCIVSLPACGGGTNAADNVTAISISPTSLTVALNSQADFTATVTLANSTITTNTSVTWQVNGADGGTSATGTIVPSTTDVDVGVYTAPAVVPSTNNGQVSITAIITQAATTTSTATSTITSNTATLTVGAGSGLAVMPTQATVPAGGTKDFSALLNSVTYPGVTWSVSSANGGNVGSIDSTGAYTAPGVPPPGGTVTITATYTPTSGNPSTATANAIIVYADPSLQGPFAFSYTGNNASGLISVAGHFFADGAGGITGGVEDIDSFGSRVAQRVLIIGGSSGGPGSSYTVGPDGRTKAVIATEQGTETWEFVVTSSHHAQMTRFDSGVSASGTIDQQNLNALGNNVVGEILGNYVFSASGGDAQLEPMGVAGRFTASGSGSIPQSASIIDVNDNTAVTQSDITLNGSYSVAALDAGTGRGTLILSSTSLGSTPLQFTFYVIGTDQSGNTITQMHFIEADQVDYLAGDIFSAHSGNSFAASSLASGNYVFTTGGNSSSEESYAAGGVFTSDGNGNVSSGVLDTNNAGTVTPNATIGACPYSVNSITGRINLVLSTSSGSCTAGSGVSEFAVYQTAQNTALMLELDSNASSVGTSYLQAGSPVALSGNFALAFVGQGIFDNAPSSYQSNATGHAVLAGTGVSSGDLDINIYGNPPDPNDPITTTASTTTTGSSIGAPATNGRGTATIIATDPPATYTFAYYVINAQTAIFVGQDAGRVETGVIILQY